MSKVSILTYLTLLFLNLRYIIMEGNAKEKDSLVFMPNTCTGLHAMIDFLTIETYLLCKSSLLLVGPIKGSYDCLSRLWLLFPCFGWDSTPLYTPGFYGDGSTDHTTHLLYRRMALLARQVDE